MCKNSISNVILSSEKRLGIICFWAAIIGLIIELLLLISICNNPQGPTRQMLMQAFAYKVWHTMNDCLIYFRCIWIYLILQCKYELVMCWLINWCCLFAVLVLNLICSFAVWKQKRLDVYTSMRLLNQFLIQYIQPFFCLPVSCAGVQTQMEHSKPLSPPPLWSLLLHQCPQQSPPAPTQRHCPKNTQVRLDLHSIAIHTTDRLMWSQIVLFIIWMASWRFT